MSFPAPTGRSVTPDHTQKIGQTQSWFSKLKERCVWRHEFETLDQAREVIAAYIDHYHHRPHSGLNYRTPSEVRQTWDDAGEPLQNTAA
jgi:transposase InsO family protein